MNNQMLCIGIFVAIIQVVLYKSFLGEIWSYSETSMKKKLNLILLKFSEEEQVVYELFQNKYKGLNWKVSITSVIPVSEFSACMLVSLGENLSFGFDYYSNPLHTSKLGSSTLSIIDPMKKNVTFESLGLKNLEKAMDIFLSMNAHKEILEYIEKNNQQSLMNQIDKKDIFLKGILPSDTEKTIIQNKKSLLNKIANI